MRAGEPPPIVVGRDAELARLVDLLGADRPVAVVGEAGIGKTTLVRAAASMADRRLHEGGGFATLAWMPYLALDRATGLTSTGDPEVVAARVERVVGPDVLLIDDLQWTDPATRVVVDLLIDRIAIVVAIRAGVSTTDEVLGPLRARSVAAIHLGGLGDDDAMGLVRRLLPDVPPRQRQRVVERAGGNPLLLAELASTGETSTSLARAILGQVRTLPRNERHALEFLALADRPMPAELIGPAASRLAARGLVVAGSDGLAVRHSLIAEAIAAQIEPPRRARLHGRLAGSLSDPAERARHLAAAGRMTEAADVAIAALDGTSDPRTRAALLRVAAQTASDGGVIWRVRAAQQLQAIGSPEEAIALLEAPLDGDDDLRALGAAALAGSLDHEGRSDEAWAVIDGARDLRPSPGGEGAIELAITEGVVLVNRGRLEEALAIAERTSAATGEAARAPRLAGHLAALRLYAGTTDRLDALEDAVEASLATGDGRTAAGRAMDLYYMALALRGATAALTLADGAAERLERLGYHTRAAELRAESAQAEIFAGDLADAVLHIDERLEEPLGLLSRQRLGYNRGLALGYLGRFEDAERTFTEVEAVATDAFDGRGALLWCWSEAALWAGQAARALDLASRSLEYTAFNDAEFVLPSLSRAWAEVELGRTPAEAAIEAPFPGLAGAAPEVRGLRARARGDHDAAVVAFDAAAGLWAGFHRPRELTCRWLAAEERRASGRDEAVPALEATLTAASEIGFEPLAARIRRSLRLAGVRIAAARGRGPVVELTAREAEVVGLIKGGLSNREIARRLGLGRPTVVRLVTSAMHKLGVDRRAQLAAHAGADTAEGG